MKLFKNIKKWFENQEHLFYLFLIVLIMPNIVLCFTEPLPLMAKVCNVLLPFACYYLLMTLSCNCGKMLWILFVFLFFGAFQIVLLYLFGQSIIAVDMFLNLVTTNSSEAMELLDNLLPAIVTVVLLYIPHIGYDFDSPQAPAFCGIYPQRTEKSFYAAGNLPSDSCRCLLGRLPV